MHVARRICSILGAAAGSVFLLTPLAAQMGAGGMGPGGAGNVTSMGADHSPIVLLVGRVTLEDGTPPPGPVRIERTCLQWGGGRPHPEGVTDSKGRFSINIGGEDRAMMADASEAQNGANLPDLSSCELRAVLTGFRSDVITLDAMRVRDDPNVGTIILHHEQNVEGLTISATSGLAPKDARKAYEKGLEDLKKKKAGDAQKEFEKAVAAYPKYAAAWFQLGLIHEQSGQSEEARNAYSQSVAADSKYINPYQRLYVLDAKEQKWQDAADASEHVIQLNPMDFPDAYYFNAIANMELNHLDAAEKVARQAVEADIAHQHPRMVYVLGIVLAKKGQLASAADLLRQYLQLDPNAKDADTVRQQLAQMEKLAGGHPR